jgi:hypothetical protein
MNLRDQWFNVYDMSEKCKPIELIDKWFLNASLCTQNWCEFLPADVIIVCVYSYWMIYCLVNRLSYVSYHDDNPMNDIILFIIWTMCGVKRTHDALRVFSQCSNTYFRLNFNYGNGISIELWWKMKIQFLISHDWIELKSKVNLLHEMDRNKNVSSHNFRAMKSKWTWEKSFWFKIESRAWLCKESVWQVRGVRSKITKSTYSHVYSSPWNLSLNKSKTVFAKENLPLVHSFIHSFDSCE